MGIDKTVGWETWTLYIESVNPDYESDFEGDVEAYNIEDAAKKFREEYPELKHYTEKELIKLIEKI